MTLALVSHKFLDTKMIKSVKIVSKVSEQSNSGIYNKSLLLACERGDYVKLQQLLSDYEDVNLSPCDRYGNTLVHVASKLGHEECLRILLERNASHQVQNSNLSTPLHLAAKFNKETCARMLLEDGANACVRDDSGNSPLHYAAASGSPVIVELLLKEISSNPFYNTEMEIDALNATGKTPLHIAAHFGSSSCVELLLNYNADKNACDRHENTPLHFAAKSGSHECVRNLIEVGANMCEKNESLNTPLHYAAEIGSAESIKELLDNISLSGTYVIGNEIQAVNANKKNPLHLAAQSGSLKCVKILADSITNFSFCDTLLNTPLHYAAMSGSSKCVKYLIDKGANVLLQNKEKFTALSIILNRPDGEEILTEMMDEYIEIKTSDNGRQIAKVDFGLLWPRSVANKMAVANTLYTFRKEKTKLLLHPLLKVLVHMEWMNYKYLMMTRFGVYLVYLITLGVFVANLDMISKIFLFILSILVFIFNVFFFKRGRNIVSWWIVKSLLLCIPPVLSITAAAEAGNELCGIAFLTSFLCLSFYTSGISFIDKQIGMFIHVTWETLKHSFILFLVLFGFSLTFFVLYYDKDSDGFDNFWHAFLYTTLVLLQGDSWRDLPIFGGNSSSNAIEKEDGVYSNYFTDVLVNKRFVSIMVSLLFLILVIIALLNMLVTLAVTSGEVIKDFGQVYELWNRVQILYEYNELPWMCCQKIRSKMGMSITIEHGNIPTSLWHELLNVGAIFKHKKSEKSSY
ncbi:transient receptor potential channel pyrexia-like [Periplaneta americana]|uniref:transient receptor potential channel pyrexia-like n=1 Tax=Periplaneta americana TaxID=6978 RepID=UPI0037E97A9B